MLEFQNVYFAYDKKQVFTDLSFTLANGEILAVMGESGCGKSTLLQLVAGFLKPKKGIIVNEACKISYAFQEPRLFPWLTVSENLRAVHGNLPVIYAGGVMSNSIIRRMLSVTGNEFFAEPAFSSDNAAGVALLCKKAMEEK